MAWLAPLLLMLVFGCGSPSPGEAPTPGPEEPTGPPRITAEQIVSLSRQLEGEWRLKLTEDEEQERRDALAHLQRLGDTPHARELRAALERSREDGMSVTSSTIGLRLMRSEVALTWTLVQDTPHLFSIATLDQQGRRQTFDVSFDGPDRVTLSARAGGPASRFERKTGPARTSP